MNSSVEEMFCWKESCVLVVLGCRKPFRKCRTWCMSVFSLLHRYQSEGAVHGEPHEVSASCFCVCSDLSPIYSALSEEFAVCYQRSLAFCAFRHTAGRDPETLSRSCTWKKKFPIYSQRFPHARVSDVSAYRKGVLFVLVLAHAIISALVSREPRWACAFHRVRWKEPSLQDRCSSTPVEKGKSPNFSQIDWLSWIATRKWNKHARALGFWSERACLTNEVSALHSAERKENTFSNRFLY